jgi:hypothetical protein
MGASISFDSKYKLILDPEVQCISPSSKSGGDSRYESESGSGSDAGSDAGSGAGSGSESGSGSDSDDETKIITVKITPEIVGYIRAYIRSDDFLDILDKITEIELQEYGHGPESALVFDSQTVVYNMNDNKIESSGIWEYIEPPPPAPKNSRKHKSKSRSNGDDNADADAAAAAAKNEFKTKEDDLSVSEIETVIAERFKEYSERHEFIIHESKTRMFILNIHSIYVVKE